MPTLGTPLSPHATRVLLLGSGELGKEVAIELQRFGVEVIAADRYAERAGDAGRAPQPRDRHARRRGAARADRARAARTSSCPRSRRSTRRRWSSSRREARAAARDPDRARRAPDDGSRRHPPPRRREARPADLAVPLRRHARATTATPSRADRHAVRGQAGDVVVGQGPERGAHATPTSSARGTTRRPAAAPARAASSSKASSTSTTRSRCSPCATPAAPASASRSATCRSTATTARAGSRSR